MTEQDHSPGIADDTQGHVAAKDDDTADDTQGQVAAKDEDTADDTDGHGLRHG